MRKRTVSYVADTALWYLIYFLPVVLYVAFLFIYPANNSGSTVPMSFDLFLEDIGLTLATDNIVFSTLYDIFGVGGVLPLFDSSGPVIILSWYVVMVIVHLAVDTLIFIPKLAHKWLNSCTGGRD